MAKKLSAENKLIANVVNNCSGTGENEDVTCASEIQQLF
jgi:hypothetical protein